MAYDGAGFTHTGNEGNRNRFGNLLFGVVITKQILQQAVTIGAAATLIPTTPILARHSLLIFNNSDSPVYIGSSTVTTADGYPIYPHGQLSIQIEDGVSLYGIAAVAGKELRIVEGA